MDVENLKNDLGYAGKPKIWQQAFNALVRVFKKSENDNLIALKQVVTAHNDNLQNECSCEYREMVIGGQARRCPACPMQYNFPIDAIANLAKIDDMIQLSITPELCVIIERKVEEQVKASGITAPIHRLDGFSIISVINEHLADGIVASKTGVDWTFCEDDLPADGQRVQYYVEGKLVDIAIFKSLVNGFQHNKFKSERTGMFIDDVIAWRKITEPKKKVIN